MKKQLIIVGITLVLIVVGLSGCTQEDALSGLGYVNREYGIGINPPDGWTVDENITQYLVNFYGPTIDEFQIYLSISKAYTLEPDETLSSLFDDMLGTYSVAWPNFSAISTGARMVNSMDAYELVYTFTFDSHNISGKHIMVEKNGKICGIIFLATVDTYDTYLSDIEQSIESLVII